GFSRDWSSDVCASDLMTPVKQIEKVEGELFQLAEKGRYDGGFENFSSALSASIKMAGEAYQRDGGLSGIATGLDDLDRQMGGLQDRKSVVEGKGGARH